MRESKLNKRFLSIIIAILIIVGILPITTVEALTNKVIDNTISNYLAKEYIYYVLEDRLADKNIVEKFTPSSYFSAYIQQAYKNSAAQLKKIFKTIQGWTLNDYGQHLYYRDGKALTGWQDIGLGNNKKTYYFAQDGIMESGGWKKIEGHDYYFYNDGSIAKNTSIDGYKVDEDGRLQDTKPVSDQQKDDGESSYNYYDYSDDTDTDTDTDIGYEKIYNINFSAEENGTLSASVDNENIITGTYVLEGKYIEFIARPEDRYRVKRWILNGQTIENNTTNTLKVLNISDTRIVVEFELEDIEHNDTEDTEERPMGTYSNNSQDGGLLQAGQDATYVGFGYNILNKPYFEPIGFERGFNILDREKVKKAIEKSSSINQNPNKYIAGKDLRSFQEQLSTNMSLSVNYPAFSGSIKTEYNMEKTKQSNTHFIKQMNGYISHSEYLPNSIKLKEILDETFQEELEDENISPEKLFERYGTHLLREVLMGARCTYSYTYSSESEETSSQVQARVEAAYKFLSGEISGAKAEEAQQFLESTNFHSVLIGGKYIDASTLGRLSENFPDWVATIRDNPPDIYGVSSTNSLVPIWELTDNNERKKELEEYFNKSGTILSDWLKEQSEIPEKPSTKEYIESIIITSNKSEAKAKDGSSYKDYIRIDKDLNKGARGNYIYLWYKTTTDPDNALHDIRFTYDGFDDIPSIYTKNDQDLNAGAGGKYIYMWTSKKPKMPGDLPITGIEIFYGKNANMPSGHKVAQADWYDKGYKHDRAELNSGAGGEYIYLGFTTK